MKKNAWVGSIAAVLCVTFIASCTPKEQETRMYLGPKAEATDAQPAVTETTAARRTLSDFGCQSRNALMVSDFYISELFSEEEDSQYVIDFPSDAVGFMAVSSDMQTSIAYIELASEEEMDDLLESFFQSLEIDPQENLLYSTDTRSEYQLEEDGTNTRVVVDNEMLSILFLYEGETEDANVKKAFGL